MDLGLGNLTELKAHLLNAALRANTDYDAALAALGKGVATRFEQYTDRKFGRATGATYQTNADRLHVVLDRYPIEQITKIELRSSIADGWIDQGTPNSLILDLLNESGIVKFGGMLGGHYQRIRFTFDGGFWYATAPAIVVQSGTVTIPQGGMAAVVEFDTAFAGIPAVKASCITPGDGVILRGWAYETSATEFTARLSAPAPAAGYTISWIAVYGSADADPSIFQEGSAAITIGEGQKPIAFGTEFAAAPIVVCDVLTPDGGYLIADAPNSITTAGFTALLSYQIPASGYKLQWIAVSPTAAAAAATLPTGATALPDDLKFAWLLQCEATWQLRDKLGLDLGQPPESRKTLNLSALNLVPEVLAILGGYRRYAG